MVKVGNTRKWPPEIIDNIAAHLANFNPNLLQTVSSNGQTITLAHALSWSGLTNTDAWNQLQDSNSDLADLILSVHASALALPNANPLIQNQLTPC